MSSFTESKQEKKVDSTSSCLCMNEVFNSEYQIQAIELAYIASLLQFNTPLPCP